MTSIISARDADLNSTMSSLPVGWNLSDLHKVKKRNVKVFSTFSCGGGSTMGYKLAGCKMVGCLEIDEKIMEIYKENHNPEHSFRMAIQDFNKLDDEKLPKELYELDILDGSPPCSVFSMAGKREKKWGQEHYFREGQEVQKLDDLFFHFIDTVKRFKPKIAIAENVTGLVKGNAKGYVKEIFTGFKNAGYDVQLFQLNAATMSVPQARRRVFFIARRKDLDLPPIQLSFKDKPRNYFDMIAGINDLGKRKPLTRLLTQYWRSTKIGDNCSRHHPKGHFFSTYKINPYLPLPTVTAGNKTHTLWDIPSYFTDKELIRAQTFPDDFNFLKQDVQYVTGMSVPPYMIKKLADKLIDFWKLG